jgi:hypothetical protein
MASNRLVLYPRLGKWENSWAVEEPRTVALENFRKLIETNLAKERYGAIKTIVSFHAK